MKIDDFSLRRVFSPFGHGVTVQHQASPHDVVFLHEPGAGIALFVQQCQRQYYWQREVLSTSNGPIPQNCCYSKVFLIGKKPEFPTIFLSTSQSSS